MVDIVNQLCVKSFHIKAENGDEWTAVQGKEYTTTVPDDNETITVLSNFWVEVPKDHFVLSETNPYPMNRGE